MALLNFTSPFLAITPNPPPTSYYHTGPTPFTGPGTLPNLPNSGDLQQGPYSYPPPQNPFLREDFNNNHNNNNNNNRASGGNIGANNGGSSFLTNHHHHHHQPTFTKVTDEGIRTKVHAVIDYDDDDDEDGDNFGIQQHPSVTPIQGPIYIKNGSVPVVPLYSYPILNNGTIVQIPILWTALSVALGLELRGDYIRGVPCIKRDQQLYCPTAGNSYPLDRIELFIDENKALMKRMYGEFDMDTTTQQFNVKKRKRSTPTTTTIPGVPDLHFDPGPDPVIMSKNPLLEKVREPRQYTRTNQTTDSGRVDACGGKAEVLTPYWAANSAGKMRAIVNTKHFEQAIHQEVCTNVRTSRCSGDCGCEQKYKWHRLLAYDPDDDCRGVFMDWFLFPACCVCRCDPT